MAKCRKCRDKKKSLDRSPRRPPRGSIRKARREEQRRRKKARLAAEKAHQSPVQLSGGETIRESVVSVV